MLGYNPQVYHLNHHISFTPLFKLKLYLPIFRFLVFVIFSNPTRLILIFRLKNHHEVYFNLFVNFIFFHYQI